MPKKKQKKDGSIELISGIMSNPPKIQIKSLDSVGGKYPTRKGTGNHDYIGDDTTAFDDAKIIIPKSIKIFCIGSFKWIIE